MKKFLKKIICIILSISYILLILSIILKITLVDAIVIGFTKNDITERFINAIVVNFPEINNQELSKIKNQVYDSNEIKEITTLYFDALLNDITNDTISNVDISPQLDSLINDNITYIPSIYRKEITNRIKQINFNKIYNDLLEVVKYKTNEKTREVIGLYNDFTSYKTIAFLAIIIILSVLFLILLNKSIFASFYNLGITFLISGGIMIVLLFLIKNFSLYITALMFGRSIPIDYFVLAVISFATLALGMIMIEIYEAYNENKHKKKRA